MIYYSNSILAISTTMHYYIEFVKLINMTKGQLNALKLK